ncbi:hypothetical protein Q5752_005935 [Cryptotrichosporon argae]
MTKHRRSDLPHSAARASAARAPLSLPYRVALVATVTMPPALSNGAGKGHLRGIRPPVQIADIEHLPMYDLYHYYDPPSPSSSSDSDAGPSEPRAPLLSNSGRKLEYAARWMRRGKITAWGPSYEEAERRDGGRKRLRLCVEELMPDAAVEAGAVPPPNVTKQVVQRHQRKQRRIEDAAYLLPHLAGSTSPPLSTADLAPMLALPQSYLDIALSSAMRHTLSDDTMERSLLSTAGALLEGERGLFQALGRLRDVLRLREQDVPENVRPVVDGTTNGEANESAAPATVSEEDQIPPLPHVSDTDNLWRVTQEHAQQQPAPTITFTATPKGMAAPSSTPAAAPPTLTPMHRLFTCPDGIMFNSVPAVGASSARRTMYNIDLPSQQRAVDDALERISELLADCTEYRDRLEEARGRVADIARARKLVWKTIDARAQRELDRIEGKA